MRNAVHAVQSGTCAMQGEILHEHAGPGSTKGRKGHCRRVWQQPEHKGIQMGSPVAAHASMHYSAHSWMRRIVDGYMGLNYGRVPAPGNGCSAYVSSLRRIPLCPQRIQYCEPARINHYTTMQYVCHENETTLPCQSCTIASSGAAAPLTRSHRAPRCHVPSLTCPTHPSRHLLTYPRSALLQSHQRTRPPDHVLVCSCFTSIPSCLPRFNLPFPNAHVCAPAHPACPSSPPACTCAACVHRRPAPVLPI
jgi:hypothetical protein